MAATQAAIGARQAIFSFAVCLPTPSNFDLRGSSSSLLKHFLTFECSRMLRPKRRLRSWALKGRRRQLFKLKNLECGRSKKALTTCLWMEHKWPKNEEKGNVVLVIVQSAALSCCDLYTCHEFMRHVANDGNGIDWCSSEHMSWQRANWDEIRHGTRAKVNSEVNQDKIQGDWRVQILCQERALWILWDPYSSLQQPYAEFDDALYLYIIYI